MSDAATGSPLVILGASTRAAAWSAIDSGLQPRCADLFADSDLVRVATAFAVPEYPDGLINAARTLGAHVGSPCPWMYTGALEHHIETIEALGRMTERGELGPLLGNGPDVLRRVRDPFWVNETCRRHGLPCPAVQPLDNPPPADGTWLLKPVARHPGQTISRWNGMQPQTGGWVFQEWKAGESFSAACVGSGGSARVLGITRQLVGLPGFHAPEWGWCGSVGPISPGLEITRHVDLLAETLARESGLTGLFGIDLVVDDAITWPIEINPRYTGSMEVIERATGLSMIGEHVRASGAAAVPDRGNPCAPVAQQRHAGCLVGKGILFAPRDGFLDRAPSAGPTWDVADVPVPGSLVQAGNPVCSVLVRGTSVADVQQRLAASCAAIEHQALPDHSDR